MPCGPDARATPGCHSRKTRGCLGATTTGSAVTAPRSRSLSTRRRASYSPRMGQQKASFAAVRPGNERQRWASMRWWKRSRVAASRPSRAAISRSRSPFLQDVRSSALIRPRDATARRQSRVSANRSGSSFNWSVAVMPISPPRWSSPAGGSGSLPLVGLGLQEPTMPWHSIFGRRPFAFTGKITRVEARLGQCGEALHDATRRGRRTRHEARRRVPPDGDRLGPCGGSRLCAGRRERRLRPLARLRPRAGRQARALRQARPHAALYRPEPLPRGVRPVRVPRRLHAEPRAGHRHRDPAAAPDRAGCQASRGGGRADPRAPAPRRRHRLEPRGVRGPQRGLPHAGPPRQRADRSHAKALDGAHRQLQRLSTISSTEPASTPCPSSARSRCGWAAWPSPC